MNPIFWIVICILLIVAIVAVVLWKVINTYLNVNHRLGIVADVPLSMKTGVMTLNLLNASSYPQIWSRHESEITIHVEGVNLNCTLYKVPENPNGFQLTYPEKFNHEQMMALVLAIKSGIFQTSFDGGKTLIKTHSVKDKIAKKIKVKLDSTTLDDKLQRLKKEMRKDILNSDKYYYLSHEEHYDGTGVLSHINEGKTTPTSLRYQLIVPKDHISLQNGGNPADETTKFYYVFEGELYQFKSKFLGRIDDFYEWDFIDLEPGRIYTGISVSLDGKNFFPSTAMFGITRNANGILATLDEAPLAIPPKSEKGIPMGWDEEKSIRMMGDNLTKINYDVIAKKHYEYVDEIGFVTLSKAEEVYDQFDWLKTGKVKKKEQ